ncbi:DNA excision repair protein ERCC-6-like isoform X2 [Crotalus tigris]|uniref:DNA excision repair protein ERCC-6-like isoform X2 n=1 Tax=Crotalus tigris TaxID=88082 RepID=UPI00192F6B19|nr:DNA excision repair protein ERCC-6-like isoform X2 [Crotalus tigris]
MAGLADLNPAQIEEYRRYVSQAKQEARSGNLEASIQLFQQALEIHFSEKLTANIKKLEEALASLSMDQEDDDFVDVCQSGLMLYGEIHAKLFDHQREGVAFLYKLYREGRKGGILADDMGLGKTVQIIAFLSGMFDAELIRSVLLVLPTTLLNNWVKEFAKWTPGLRVKVFHGTSKAERNRYLERIQRRNGVLLTTYQMVLNNWQQLSSFDGKEFVWDYIILDEAHKIKTPSAKTTKSVHSIPSKNRILLTGTPVQNNLKELWALFDFACQGSLLGTLKTFKMEYENPITKAREKDATPGEKALGLKISENLMSIIKPYFLRRTKNELQKKKKTEFPNHLPEDQSKGVAPAMPSLPRKNEFIVWVFLAPVQEEIYRKFISLDHIKELLMSTRSPLAELSILKKLCDHPRLLSNRACSQLGLEASNYSEEDVGENDLPDMKRSIEHVSDEMLIQESGKLSFLVALLERLQDEGHRTLVFSQSRKMLDIIERILTHRGFKLMRIDGTVTHLLEREKRIGMFQKDGDYSVFLLTTQVGGVGLTLTAASRVVIFDPSWNPATDAQAVDRAYRIGQKDNVIIYRLITCGTVEEKIYRRQVFKDSLIRQSMGDKKNPYRYFSRQELRELFTLEDTRSSATQLQLQSLHATQRKTDTELDEHIAYLHMLEIFGISDHDLIYTRETAHEDEAENEEAHRYIEHRVQKAQELVRLESQLNDQLMRNIRNTTEGAWLRDIDSSTQPKTKPPKSSPSDTLGPSMSESTSPIVVDSPTPSMKKSPTPPPSPVVTPPVYSSPVVNNEIVDLVSDDDNDVVSDMVNLSSKMTSLMIEDVADEEMAQIISNMEDNSSSEQKEHQFPSLQECELKSGTGLVSPFLTPSVFNKVDCSPESRAISELPAKDTDDEQMVFHTNNTDVLHSKKKDYQVIGLQTDEQNESLNVVSSFPKAISLSMEDNVNSESKRISCDPSPEARSELKDVQMKLLQESFVHPFDDGRHQSETEMSLDVLPISCGDACEKMSSLMIEDGADEQMAQIIFNMEDNSSSEQKEHQFPSLQECEIKSGTSLMSPFLTPSVSNKVDCSPEFRAISELPAKDTDDEQMVFHTNNTDVLHSKNKEYQLSELLTDEQDEILNVVSSFPQAISLSMEDNVISESKRISCDPSPEARSELKDVQMKLLQESFVHPSDDGRHQSETEMSLDVLPISRGDASEINALDAVAPHGTRTSKMTKSSTLQKSGARETRQDESFDICSQFQINFNLTLEDSENRPQAISEKDMSLEETEDEGFQLRLDSYCSSATESVGGEHGHPRNPQTCNAVEGSVVMDDANSPCDSSDSFGWGKKKPTAIIVSDEEDENDELIDDLDEAKAGGICMSTPKTNRPTAAVCFSPRIKLSGRRSTASRRSLFDVVLEEVEGAPREAGTASDVSNDRSVQHEFEEELTQNYTEQTSEELEEEPSGETLDSESESSHLHDTDTSRGESSL